MRSSLGAAFWGAQPAAGHSSPPDRVPDAWLALLASHIDMSTAENIARACKAGLEFRKRISTLKAKAVVDGDSTEEQLADLQQDLSQRSCPPAVAVVKLVDDSSSDEHDRILDVLEVAAPHLTELTLQPDTKGHGFGLARAGTQFLLAAGELGAIWLCCSHRRTGSWRTAFGRARTRACVLPRRSVPAVR